MAYQNFFAAKLYTDIGASDTTITLDTAPAVTSGRMVLEARNPTQREIITYTGVSGNQLTGVTRGVGGTSAKSHLKNALVEMNLTAEDLQELYDAFDNFVATNGNGWVDLGVAPSLQATNGRRSFDIQIPGDKTAVLSKGMAVQIPRTSSPVTKSALFNGSSQYAAKTSPSGITFTDDWTCEAWVYRGATGSGDILGKASSTNNGFRFGFFTDGTLWIIGYTSSGYRYYSSRQGVPANRWTHVAASMDLSGNVGHIYIDGVEVTGSMTQTFAVTAFTNTGDLYIGRRAGGASDYYNGAITDVRLWSTVRTAQQIKDNMNQQLTGSESGLAGYWKLNGDWNDSTANANHLTATGSPSITNAQYPFHSVEFARLTSDPVLSGGNTNVTVRTLYNYTLPNQSYGNISYSTDVAPFGLPTGYSNGLHAGNIRMFSAAKTSTQATNATNANALVTWDTVDEYMNTGDFNLAGNSWTAPADGWLETIITLTIEGGDGTNDDSMNWGLQKNGSWYLAPTDNWRFYSKAGVELPRSITVSLPVSAGDTITVTYEGVAFSVNILGSANRQSVWTGKFTPNY